jgi:hypothetical protein
MSFTGTRTIKKSGGKQANDGHREGRDDRRCRQGGQASDRRSESRKYSDPGRALSSRARPALRHRSPAVNRERRRRRAAVQGLAPLALPPLRRRRPDRQPDEGTETSVTGLLEAAEALDALANGMQPDRVTVITGALALDALRWSTLDPDILAAAHGLAIVATGGSLDLNGVGRTRARQLAASDRAVAAGRGHDSLPAASRASHFS